MQTDWRSVRPTWFAFLTTLLLAGCNDVQSISHTATELERLRRSVDAAGDALGDCTECRAISTLTNNALGNAFASPYSDNGHSVLASLPSFPEGGNDTEAAAYLSQLWKSAFIYSPAYRKTLNALYDSGGKDCLGPLPWMESWRNKKRDRDSYP